MAKYLTKKEYITSLQTILEYCDDKTLEAEDEFSFFNPSEAPGEISSYSKEEEVWVELADKVRTFSGKNAKEYRQFIESLFRLCNEWNLNASSDLGALPLSSEYFNEFSELFIRRSDSWRDLYDSLKRLLNGEVIDEIYKTGSTGKTNIQLFSID